MTKKTKKRIFKAFLKSYVLFTAIILTAIFIDYGTAKATLFVLNPVDTYEQAELNIERKIKVKDERLKVYTPEQAKQRIIEIAKERNFKQLDKFLKVVECESRFNQFAYHVNNDGSVDRGALMWNDHWHSKMTNAQSFDLDYSVNKAMDYFDKGSGNLWACYHLTNI